MYSLLLAALACNLPGRAADAIPAPEPTQPPTIPATVVVQPEPTETLAAEVEPTEPSAGPARPFPQHALYASGSTLPDHRTREQLDEDVRRFYDYWKSEYLVDAGTSANGIRMYRIAFGQDIPARETTVSEGQGYGMTIVPLMAGYDPDAQAIFDGLWEFVRAHPSEIDPRLMDWNVPLAEGNASAFDGDVDIAFGLLLADAQWGSGGAVDYLSDANTLIAAILETTIGPDSRLPMLGDWVDPRGAVHNQYTPRSSDFMLANFAAFGRAAGNPAWSDVIAQSQAVILQIQAEYSPSTGLLPDFIQGDTEGFRPASPGFLEADRDGDYSYNAGRVPWRLGLHALAYDDGVSRASTQTISRWIQEAAGNDPANIYAGYRLSGEPRPGSEYFTSFFASPFGVAAMSDPAQQAWLNAIYDSVFDRHEDYYEDSVTLICLLIMTGNHWIP